jgi:dTDP-4-dehydrorhamnose 3,5-epimerase-like enzyme
MELLNAIKWIDFPSNVDTRGVLTSIEGGIDIPFTIKRIFYMHHILSERGGHAHRDTDQILIAIAGQFKMDLSDGLSKKTFQLNDPKRGLYIPRMIFIHIYDFSPEAVCFVLANTHYDIKKSIRNWEDYKKAIL